MNILLSVIVLFGIFFVLLFLGVPISVGIVVSSLATTLMNLPWDQVIFIIMQKMNSGVESFSLLAIPLFILAGNIMNNGGSSTSPSSSSAASPAPWPTPTCWATCSSARCPALPWRLRRPSAAP